MKADPSLFIKMEKVARPASKWNCCHCNEEFTGYPAIAESQRPRCPECYKLIMAGLSPNQPNPLKHLAPGSSVTVTKNVLKATLTVLCGKCEGMGTIQDFVTHEFTACSRCQGSGLVIRSMEPPLPPKPPSPADLAKVRRSLEKTLKVVE